MGSREKQSVKERVDTDESLRAERSKTDAELASTRSAIEEDADEVLSRARERAEAQLNAARERTDRELDTATVSARAQRKIVAERADEDRASAEERATADERLQVERAERKRALESLLRLERESTDERLLVERARADETVATRDDFLGMVSHDLRTMLGGIALNAALLMRQSAGSTAEGAATIERAERIQRYTARMNRLVGDLLDVVSLEAGQLAVTRQPEDASQLVRDAMETFQPSFSAKGLTLDAQIEPGTLPAEFDHERILQVLANLLSNALKFTPEGGRVTLHVARSGSNVRFSLTDTGIGVPPAELDAIFERFRQVQAKDRRGLGLGLYIARCIVEAHGGKIWAEQQEGGGTAFHFTLPAAATPQSA